MQMKISAQDNIKNPRFLFKFTQEQMKEMGWKQGDILRVITKKKDNKVILKKVANKYAKQVAHTITNMGSGVFEFSSGIGVKHTNRRFQSSPAHNTSAIVEVINGCNHIEVQLPQEVFH